MTDFERLEAMGYRFRLDGERITYSIFGGAPPPEGAELLRRLNRAAVRQILLDRAEGFRIVPQEEGLPPMPEELKAIYREAFAFHQRWQGRTKDWMAVCEDAKETALRGQNRAFLTDLLAAVYGELEREQQTQGKPGGA